MKIICQTHIENMLTSTKIMLKTEEFFFYFISTIKTSIAHAAFFCDGECVFLLAAIKSNLIFSMNKKKLNFICEFVLFRI